MPRIAVFIRELGTAAGAFERQAAAAAGLEGCLVPRRTVALMHHLIVPFETEPGQGAQYPGGGSGDDAGTIQILDADQPATAVRSGIEVARRRGIERT